VELRQRFGAVGFDVGFGVSLSANFSADFSASFSARRGWCEGMWFGGGRRAHFSAP